jgi:membrane protease YdiL (CAAX protease family)
MRSSAILVCFAWACVAPAIPAPAPPDPARFQHAADQDPRVRAAAAAELIGDPNPHATDMLVTLVQRDRDPAVRIAAANAIAERRDASLDDVLASAAERDPDLAVRHAAAAAHELLWPWGKQPRTAAGLSLLCPGCGQIYLHEDVEGWMQDIAAGGLVVGGYLLIRGHTVSLDSAADSPKVPIGAELLLLGQNLWFYSIFDAYRDARMLRGDVGYSHAITHESLAHLALSPVRPSVLKSPWVWAGVPAALALGLGITYLSSPSSFTANPSIFDVKDVNVLGHHFGRATGFAAGEGYLAGLFSGVGVGEESLFRGLIQTELMERFGTWGGLAAASAIFGAAHLVNYAQPGADPKQALIAIPTIAVLGSSLGLAYIETGYKLETGVAMHFWYDFLLSTVAFALDPTHQPFVVQVGSPM